MIVGVPPLREAVEGTAGLRMLAKMLVRNLVRDLVSKH